MSNKRINKAYIRYDGNGRVIPGALLLNRFKPTGGGKWHEISAYECCNSAPVIALRLVFDSIESANNIVGDAYNLSDWNTFFDLPTNGNPFTSIIVVGSEIQLFGGSNITIKDELFYDTGSYNNFLLEIIDNAGCIVEVGTDSFYYCTELTTIILPYATSIALYPFEYCLSLQTINLSSCLNLGPTVGDDYVFYEVVGNNVTLTIPAALMTCNSGNPDGDIVELQSNNTVTVITV